MNYCCDVAGLHAKNRDGADRKAIVRKYFRENLDCVSGMILVRDMVNRFDKNAIAEFMKVRGAFREKHLQIGYLEREVAKEVSSFTDDGGLVGSEDVVDFWIPDLKHVVPRMTIRFTASWSEEDVEDKKAIKRQINREKRLSRQVTDRDIIGSGTSLHEVITPENNQQSTSSQYTKSDKVIMLILSTVILLITGFFILS